MTVDEAFAVWPNLAKKSQCIGSPVMAGNAVEGDWLPAFMALKP